MNYAKLKPLFSVPLMDFEYGQISEDERKTINHYLDDLRPNVYNFTTKESYILDKGLSKLKKFIEIAIDTYVINVIVGDKYDENLSFKITQSWGNLTRPGSEGHHLHKHSNSVISGVFYVQTNDVDNITFANPLLAHDTIRIRTKEYNQFNSYTWRYPVSTGKLILFPSNVSHHVDPPIGDKDRISLSFNVFPTGKIGDSTDLNELRI